MSEIVCQVGNQAGQVEFIWSSRGGFFQPYVVTGTQLTELRQAADQTRVALEALVFALNQDGGAPPPWEPSYELAEAGFRLFNYLLPSEDETARKVRRWLEDLRKQSGLIGLEVVVEERSADPRAFLSVPWNLVYDERPAKHKAAFQKGQGRRALAAVLVGPLQPDQRAAGRALEAAAALERPAGRRGDRPDRPRGPQRRSEAAAGPVPGRGGPDGRRLDGRAGGGAGGGLSPAALLAGARDPRVPAAGRRADRPGRPAEPAAELRRPRAARGDAGVPQRLPDGRGRVGRVVPGRAPQLRLHRGDRHRAADDRHLRQRVRPGVPAGVPAGGQAAGRAAARAAAAIGAAGPALRRPLPARDPGPVRRRRRGRPGAAADPGERPRRGRGPGRGHAAGRRARHRDR